MQEMTSKVALSEEASEKWEDLYSKSEQKFSRFKNKMTEELDKRDTQILHLKERAKTLETDNEMVNNI